MKVIWFLVKPPLPESGDGLSDGELVDCAFVSVARSDSVSVSDLVGPSACVSDLAAFVCRRPFLSRTNGVPVAPCRVKSPKEQE